MKVFGTASTGETVHRLTLDNGELSVALLTWGAVLQDVRLAGVAHSLTVGSDDLAEYEGRLRHHGAIIGPVVNRIGNARITIDGLTYELERNQDGHINLHSGKQATHRRLWEIVDHGPDFAVLRVRLADGECGLPGNREITARFALEGRTLALDITAVSDAATAFNIANHSYWNLDGARDYAGHRLTLAADRYLPIDEDAVPTGEIVLVEGTEMDFREGRVLAPHSPDLDNNFCLSDRPAPLRHVLRLKGRNGIALDVATDQPGVQVFDNRPEYRAIAIEAQFWPDAPNNPDFPSIIYPAGQPYRQSTRYSFST